MLLISESKNMFKKEWGNKRNILRIYMEDIHKGFTIKHA